mgnify:CR=1 FL=1
MRILMNYITKLQYQVDVDKLVADYKTISNQFPRDQINLTKIAGMDDNKAVTFGSGSLWNDIKQQYIAHENDWSQPIQLFANSYTIQYVLPLLNDIASQYNCVVGRLRYLTLQPKRCLTYHIDKLDYLRLHIPVITSPGAMFIHDYQVSVMHDIGHVYLFDDKAQHTAVNASRQPRTHLVASIYDSSH